MVLIESCKLTDFVNNKCMIDKIINKIIIYFKSNIKEQGILLKNIDPVPGKYIINVTINISGCNVYLYGNYENHKITFLRNGNNIFIVEISEKQKKPFNIGILSNNAGDSKICEITNFSMTKQRNQLLTETQGDIFKNDANIISEIKKNNALKCEINIDIASNIDNKKYSTQPVNFSNILSNRIMNRKISIVMSYINRREQLEFTLKTISYSNHKNIEIIVWDDGSADEHQIDDFVKTYGIQLYKVDKKNKNWVNSAVGYNNAINKATGDIIILQNPEVCHLDDILVYINEQLENNDYFAFFCYSFCNLEENKKLHNLLGTKNLYDKNYKSVIDNILKCKSPCGNTILNKEISSGWLNHIEYLPTGYHFLSALSRKKLLEMGGFDDDYSDGLCHDDDDFVRRLIKHNVLIKFIPKYCIHQWHTSYIKMEDHKELWKVNQKIFKHKILSYNINEAYNNFYSNNDKSFRLEKFNNYAKWPKKIPKILHLYWNGDKFTALHYLTITSFVFYNPDWKIRVYIPKTTNYVKPEWVTQEQKHEYCGPNLMNLLFKHNIEFVTVDFNEIGFYNDVNDVFKSDFLRWKLLYEMGGVWSDFDILYIKTLTIDIFSGGDLNCNKEDIEAGIYYIDGYFPIGFLFSAKRNDIFKKCCENSLRCYNKNIYQSMGAYMWGELFATKENILKTYKNTCILNRNTIYPFKWSEIEEFFETNSIDTIEQKYYNILNDNIVGIHWFNGSKYCKEFCSKKIDINQMSVISKLLKRYFISESKSKYINFSTFDFIFLYGFNLLEDPSHKKWEIFTNKNIKNLKILSKSMNYQGFDYNGTVVKKDLDIVPNINIDNDIHGCYINNKIYPKVSIVCVHNNKKKQLLTTLRSIENSKYKNVEVIIVDDNSKETERLEDIVNDFPFIIKLKRMDTIDKVYTNKCIPYNAGFDLVSGKIVIIQNCEVCHINDVISYVVNNIKDNDYISFPCAASPNFEANAYIKNIVYHNNNNSQEHLKNILKFKPRNNNIMWYNHQTINPSYNIYCAATFTKNIYKIRGFSTIYKDDHNYNDYDFILKLWYDIKLNLIIPNEYNSLVIYQYPQYSNLLQTDKGKNKQIYERIEKKKILLSKSKSNLIPKIFNCYWDMTHLPYLCYLTVKSFSYYNPCWKINIYVPSIKSNSTLNEKNDKEKYTGKDYWNNLINLPNVEVLKVDFKTIGFYDNIPEIIKSYYIRWHILGEIGGLWSDFDILYINSIENMIQNNSDFDTLIFDVDNKYYPIGLFMSKPNNNFFIKLKEQTLYNYNKNETNDINNKMIKLLWPTSQDIINEFKENKFWVEDASIYLPYQFNELSKLFFANDIFNVTKKTIGIYWFSGNAIALKYNNNISNELVINNKTISVFVNKFLDIIQNDTLTNDIVILNPKF